MKAARFNEYGHANVVTVTNIEEPSPKEGQVKVEVHAASLNPFDTIVREGYMKDMIPLSLPVTIGGDIAGIVTEISDGVTNVSVGDKVYGQANVVAGNSGAFAEFAATSAGQISKMPSNTDFETAASLPLVGVSAIQALTQHIGLKSGQKLFVHGGAGAIGSIAIQIAKQLGAYVATTATGDQIELVKSLGADEVIDYKAADFSTELSDFDAVFDTVGGEDFVKSFSILKPGSPAVTMIAQGFDEAAKENSINAISQMTHVSTETLQALTELVESGVVTARVGKVFPLADVQAAFEARESGSVKGKVVLSIQ